MGKAAYYSNEDLQQLYANRESDERFTEWLDFIRSDLLNLPFGVVKTDDSKLHHVPVEIAADASFTSPDGISCIATSYKSKGGAVSMRFFKAMQCKNSLCAELEAIYYALARIPFAEQTVILYNDCHNAIEILEKSAKGEIRLKRKSYGEAIHRINRLIKDNALTVSFVWRARESQFLTDMNANYFRAFCLEFRIEFEQYQCSINGREYDYTNMSGEWKKLRPSFLIDDSFKELSDRKFKEFCDRKYGGIPKIPSSD